MALHDADMTRLSLVKWRVTVEGGCAEIEVMNLMKGNEIGREKRRAQHEVELEQFTFMMVPSPILTNSSSVLAINQKTDSFSVIRCATRFSDPNKHTGAARDISR